jgi:hypothetical protein
VKNILLLLILTSFLSCHKDTFDPNQEVPATIIDLQLGQTIYCGCCQGYRVQIGSKQYFTNRVASPFGNPNTKVWIRYKQPEEGCESESTNRIQITSVRSR